MGHWGSFFATACLLFLPFQSRAYPLDTTRTFFFHIGADAGWIAGKVDVLKDRKSEEQSGTTNLSLFGGRAGIFSGVTYRHPSHIFFGSEVSCSWACARGESVIPHIPYTKFDVKHNQCYGVFFYAGYTCCAVSPYVKVGWTRGKFAATSTSERDPDFEDEGDGRQSVWRSGLSLGVGADVCVAPGILVGGAFSYTWCKKFTFETSGIDPKVFYTLTPKMPDFCVRARILFPRGRRACSDRACHKTT